jgi:uncharacterized membrane protein
VFGNKFQKKGFRGAKMTSIYLWLKFLHVVAAVTFMVAHGTSIAISFRLKHEEDVARIKAMLDVSGTMWIAMMLSLLVSGIAGIGLVLWPIGGRKGGSGSRLYCWS